MSGLRERNKERRRREILAAAEVLFRERGYGAAAVADIAARAQVAEGTVFNYYPTKGDLLLDLMVQENARVMARLDAAPANGDSSACNVVAEFFDIVTEESFALVDRATWREVAALLVTSAQSPFAGRYLDLRAALKRRLTTLLGELVHDGRLPAANPSALADLLWRAYWGLFQFLIASDNLAPADLRRSLARDLALILPNETGETP